MKTLICVLLIGVAVVSAQEDTGQIRNFLRVNEQFCTGGQPRLEHLEKLKAEGVKAIINLRQPSEHRAEEEAAKAKELGLRYFNIPVVYRDPKEEQVTEFLKLTDDPANRPAFIHCTAAIRVAGFWLIRRVLRDGWKFEDAEAEAHKIGNLREGAHLVEFAKKYIEKHQQKAAGSDLPSDPMKFGVFTARFDPAGTFALSGDRWPKMDGTWKKSGEEMELTTTGAPKGCEGAGKYRVNVQNRGMSFDVISDDCVPRRMILDRSAWRPATETVVIAPRNITRTSGERMSSRLKPESAKGSWPSFRGPHASGVAEGQKLPDQWNGKTGENILWHTKIPGLAHSSPVVWGKRVFVTSAVSTDPKATFKPGLYGDGEASKDRSQHRWMVYALDKQTGKIVWERVAFQGEPREQRHIKATYANSTPATDGRIVVAWFGSQGLYTYDVNGRLLWKVDLGRMDAGAYDIPTYEWGTASSPIIWKDLVILQCDTQADSFIIAFNAKTGETVWKTDRDEIPSWGSPTVVTTAKGEELVTNASNFIRGYDPRTGKELWRLGRSSKITAPTSIIVPGTA